MQAGQAAGVSRAPASRPSIAVFCDSPDENWRAMDLAGEMLVREWSTSLGDRVEPVPFSIDLPKIARNVPRLAARRTAFNFDRVAGRFLVYPAYAAIQRPRFDFFHVVDHTYAQLVHVLPKARTGVFCHDLDAFRSLIDRGRDPRPSWYRAMQGVSLHGLRSAAIVFFSTKVVRAEIEAAGLVPPSRLVQAPYGISPEFDANRRDDDREPLEPLGGRPYLLHVGSAVPRKRLDVLFDVYARLRVNHPDLRLVQNGAAFTSDQRAQIDALGIADSLYQPSRQRIDRRALAGLYRGATAVLVTSDAEGFGIPLVEALACGAPVFASDIPVLREVGGDAVTYCRAGDPSAWVPVLDRFLRGEAPPPPRDARLAQAAIYTWTNHARIVLDAYRALDGGRH
jgi:glycosyltransferase involved in cell wall biosynthesis